MMVVEQEGQFLEQFRQALGEVKLLEASKGFSKASMTRALSIECQGTIGWLS